MNPDGMLIFVSMQRIAFFIPDLEGGGAERTLVRLLNGMPEREYHLDLVLVKARGVFLREVPAGVRIIDLGCRSTFGALLPLARYLRREKPDVLISHLSHANTIALLAKRLFSRKTRLIVVEHALLTPDRLASRRERSVLWLMKKLYPGQDPVVAVSDEVAIDLVVKLSLNKRRVHTLYNPVIDAKITTMAQSPPDHEWFAGAPDASGFGGTDAPPLAKRNGWPVFLAVGRLSPEKGFVELLQAFARVRQQRPARLMILGEGSQRAELERTIAALGIGEDTRLPGFTGNPYAYMARCDAFILSSRWEALPGVLIEALACGCPVIATDCPGGTAGILGNGEYGDLVPVGDIDAMASAMLRIANRAEGAPTTAAQTQAVQTKVAPTQVVPVSAAPTAVVTESDADRKRRRSRAKDFSLEKSIAAYTSLINGHALRDGAGAGRLQTIVHIISGLRQGGAEQMLYNLLSMLNDPNGRNGKNDKKNGRFRHEVVCLGAEEPVRRDWAGVNRASGDWGNVDRADGDRANGERGGRFDGGLAGKLAELDIPVHFLGIRPGRLPSMRAMRRLIGLLRRIRPQQIQGWMYHGNLAASFARPWLPGRPAVLWGIHHSIAHLPDEKRMTRLLIRLGARFSARADRIIYVSEASRRQHIALGYRDTKAVTIPNGIDTTLFRPDPEARGRLLAELGPSLERPLLIGHVARYHPLKDHANFLQAAALLSRRYPQAHFVLAGSGVDDGNKELITLAEQLGIRGRIHLLGARTAIEKLLAGLDLFCLSSRSEASPLVLTEAMACGVPCVTTDVGDAADMVGDTGLSVAPHDPEALAGALETLAGTLETLSEAVPDQRGKPGLKARERVIRHYSLETTAERYQAIYEIITG